MHTPHDIIPATICSSGKEMDVTSETEMFTAGYTYQYLAGSLSVNTFTIGKELFFLKYLIRYM